MMYQSKFVAAIRCGGKILRESGENVYIPYGSEYSILLKNLSGVRSIVNVYIDGTNVVPGGLVINAGREVDLERSLATGNLTKGNKFKFIARTSNIEEHRGIELEDGLVRIEYQFERIVAPTYLSTPIIYKSAPISGHIGMAVSDYSLATTSVLTRSCTNVGSIIPQAALDVGITVPGSESNQQFFEAESFPTELSTHTMVFRLLGETTGKTITAPITVKHKPTCSTCGKVNQVAAKFCSDCGTALEIL